ncbi:MAG: 3-hydroxybutyryl-CoA dehydrogenase [Firmicutes bacterium]|nr:3-hydroxybutyryl-CoA dehydrogenase [Bacillota bacterium]
MKVAVFGVGTMGSGIAQVCAKAGHDVYMVDLNLDIVNGAIAKLEKGFNKQIEKGKMDEAGKAAIMGKLHPAEKAGIGDADLVIEAALEVMDIKKALFKELDEIVKDGAIFASNTSSLSITEIGYGLKHDFIGMHFFNPVPAMKLVEVIRGANTKQETFDTIFKLSQELGKDPIEVSEAPGFVVNKILVPMINEAFVVLQEGVANAEDIDKAMMLGCNHPMGPLHLGDLIGLDVCLNIMGVLYNESGDSKYRACPLMRKYVRAGKLGRKTGEGVFKY